MRSLLHLIVPPLCAICGKPCGAGEDVCSRCAAEISAAPGGAFRVPGVDAAWAAIPYEGAGRRLVTQLKFGARLRLARVAALAIGKGMPSLPPDTSVVPVPPDPLRHRMRGFDPANVIAAQLSRDRGLPLCRCLARHHGRRQVGRSRIERLGAGPDLRLTAPAPAAVLLLDDVTTTGATFAACAGALRLDGCTDLLAVAFARA